MSAQDLARQRGGCGEVIDVDAWCDGDAVPSTAGLCDSPAKHREHVTPPAGAGAAGDEGLRAALGKALEAATAVYPGPPPLRILRGDLGWVVDALLPEVSAYADRRAAADVELAALIVENATGLGAVTDEQLAEVARGIRDIPRFRARAAALSTPASAVAADEGTGE